MFSRSNVIFRAIIPACILLCIAVPASSAGDCGDVDNSGGVDIDDVVYLIAYIFSGGPAPDTLCCYDCPSTMTDYDGNVYQTVLIDDNCWMMENLKVTHYRNGDPIPHVTDGGGWLDLTTGAYCEYDNNPANVETYGRLYNWYSIDDSRNIAPDGWHVATDDEWKQLEMYLGMGQADADSTGWRGTDEGGKLKEAGTIHWNPPNTGATNECGFSALPGGFRSTSFSGMGGVTYFWTSTKYFSIYSWYRYLHHESSQIGRKYDFFDDRAGLSVRCVRD